MRHATLLAPPRATRRLPPQLPAWRRVDGWSEPGCCGCEEGGDCGSGHHGGAMRSTPPRLLGIWLNNQMAERMRARSPPAKPTRSRQRQADNDATLATDDPAKVPVPGRHIHSTPPEVSSQLASPSKSIHSSASALPERASLAIPPPITQQPRALLALFDPAAAAHTRLRRNRGRMRGWLAGWVRG